MAIMYPPEPPVLKPGGGNGGERRVYTLLAAGFPEDSWHVFFNLRFWTDAKCTDQREIDAIVVNPALGVLFLEIKGGRYDFLPGRGWCKWHDGTWTPDNRYGGPYGQINSAAFAFLRVASDAMKWDVQAPFRWGQGVIFPFCTLGRTDGRLPPDADGEITAEEAQCESAQHLRAWVVTRMKTLAARWPNTESITRQRLPELIKKYLAPRVESRVRLASVIARYRDLEELLTAEQRVYVKFAATRNRLRLLVQGYAGTGKTFMAVLLALQLAKQPSVSGSAARVAILCFNRNLAWQIDREMLPAGHSITVRHFHELCRDAASAAGIAVPAQPDQEWFDRGCVSALEEAFLRGSFKPFDVVLIDEGQDLFPEWLKVIEQVVVRTEGRLVVFYDPLQDLRGIGADLVAGLGEPLPVTVNCRNTREICQFVVGLEPSLAEMKPASFAPEGVRPRSRTYADPAEQVPRVEALVRSLLDEHGLTPRQIVLVSPYRKANTCLAAMESLAGLPLVDYANRYSDSRESVLFYDTVSSFKGCESEVVILHDVHGSGPAVNVMALYAAASRAKAGLFIFRSKTFQWPAGQEDLVP